MEQLELEQLMLNSDQLTPEQLKRLNYLKMKLL